MNRNLSWELDSTKVLFVWHSQTMVVPGVERQIIAAWALSSGQSRSCLQRKLSSGRKRGCLQGELAGSKTENLRTLKRLLNSRAIAELGQMKMYSD